MDRVGPRRQLKMRVVHFAESFSPLTETFVHDQVVEVQRRGLDSWVLTLRRENAAERPSDPLYEISLPSRRSLERLGSRLAVWSGSVRPDEQYNPILQRRLKWFLLSHGPNVIHAHFGPAGYLVMPVAKTLKIPLVVSFYGYDVTRLGQDDMWQRRYKQLFRSADALLVLSNVMREQLHQLGALPAKVSIIHLGRRLSEYAYRKPISPVRNWISVGRLVEKKGHLDCIRAFEIAARDTEATLTIVGDGKLRQVLIDEVESRGLVRRVRIAGSLPHREVLERMREADAFVLCSKRTDDGDTEGTPVVLLEAQALGLPCVTTRHSAIPEVIPDENQQFLAEEGDVPDIAARMVLLSQASQEELASISKYGRQKIERDYDVETETGMLLEIYARIASDREGR